MRKILILTFFIFISFYSFSQKDSVQLKSIFTEKEGNTFLVAQKFQFTMFAGSPAFMIGAGGGKIFNHKFLLGGGGYGTMKGVLVKQENYQPLNLQQNIAHNLHFGYGGFWTGYMPKWNSVFHITPSMFWAAGAISIRRSDNEKSVVTNFVYVLQPMIELELNVTEFVRVSLAPEYRFVGNVQMEGYKSNDFSGLGAVFFIKFGAF